MNFALSVNAGFSSEAEYLAAHYGFILTTGNVLPRLNLSIHGLELITAKFKPLRLDFTATNLQNRVQQSQGLLKACKPSPNLKIIDATAGLGRDAFILASSGADVLMLERHPILAAMLADAIRRLESTSENFGSLAVMYTDAKDYLFELVAVNAPDVIYLDPMHPERKKSALVKKEMQILQEIIGPDKDAITLLATAIIAAKQRVVMKWPQKSPPLIPPKYSIHGTTVRFDVYVK